MSGALHLLVAAVGIVLGTLGDRGRSAAAQEPAPPDFHVAATGDDANPGTAAAPFATLLRARDAVREKIRAGLAKDVVVAIGGGTYAIAAPLVFGPEDSGTQDVSITYAAAPGAHVVLSGGRTVGGWKKADGELWTTEVPEAKAGRWCPRQLFIDGQRAIRARTPNQGWCQTKATTPVEHGSTDQPIDIHVNTTGGRAIYGHYREYEYEQATIAGGIAAWRNPGDVELVSLRHNEGGRKAIQSIDPVAQTVRLRPPHRWAPKVYGNDWFNGVPEGRVYLENAREFLDSPGEWYLDRTSGLLTYWPRPGEDPARWTVTAPVVENTLLAVAGTREQPVVNLHFRGLRVEHVDWRLPPEGYGGLFCCNVPVFRAGCDPGHRFIEAAVEMSHARSCSFSDGAIARVGGMGLVLREGTADIAVEGNDVQQTGAGGLGLGQCNVGFGYLKAAPPPQPGEYERYRIRNNHVQRCGLDYFGAVGIALFRMRHSTIAHNLVHDTAYCGVVFPGDQDPAWDFVRGNTFERNHIYRDMRVTQDGGGLYTSFAHRDVLMRANLIHDSSGNPMSGGICLDGCTGVTFDHNVVYRNPVWNLVLFRPDDLTANTWIGNLVMPSRAPGAATSRPKQLFDGRSGWELDPGRENHAPPEAFIEAMAAYAGLEPAYRERLQGTVGQRCDLHVLDDGITWQLDLPEAGRGVVYRLDARAGKAVAVPTASGQVDALRLRGLDGTSRYRLQAFTGAIQPTPTDSSVENFVAGAAFPMVHKAAPTSELGVPAEAGGGELLDKGLALPGGPIAVWIAYERVR